MEEHGHSGHPPMTTSDNGGRPPDGIGDPRPGQGGTPMSTHGHGRRHLWERTAKPAMVWQLVKVLEDDNIALKGSLYLLWCQILTGRPWEREAHQLVSPPNHPSTTTMEPSILAQNKGDLHHWEPYLQGKAPLLSTWRNTLTACLIAAPPVWPSTGSKWSWHSKPRTSTAKCTGGQGRWQSKVDSFCNSMTNVLDGWGAGNKNNLLSCGPPNRGLSNLQPGRHKCILMSTTSGGLPTPPSKTSRYYPSKSSPTQIKSWGSNRGF